MVKRRAVTKAVYREMGRNYSPRTFKGEGIRVETPSQYEKRKGTKLPSSYGGSGGAEVKKTQPTTQPQKPKRKISNVISGIINYVKTLANSEQGIIESKRPLFSTAKDTFDESGNRVGSTSPTVGQVASGSMVGFGMGAMGGNALGMTDDEFLAAKLGIPEEELAIALKESGTDAQTLAQGLGIGADEAMVAQANAETEMQKIANKIGANVDDVAKTLQGDMDSAAEIGRKLGISESEAKAALSSMDSAEFYVNLGKERTQLRIGHLTNKYDMSKKQAEFLIKKTSVQKDVLDIINKIEPTNYMKKSMDFLKGNKRIVGKAAAYGLLASWAAMDTVGTLTTINSRDVADDVKWGKLDPAEGVKKIEHNLEILETCKKVTEYSLLHKPSEWVFGVDIFAYGVEVDIENNKEYLQKVMSYTNQTTEQVEQNPYGQNTPIGEEKTQSTADRFAEYEQKIAQGQSVLGERNDNPV